MFAPILRLFDGVVDDQRIIDPPFFCAPQYHDPESPFYRMVDGDSDKYCPACGRCDDLPPVSKGEFVKDPHNTPVHGTSGLNGTKGHLLGGAQLGRWAHDAYGHRIPWKLYRNIQPVVRVDVSARRRSVPRSAWDLRRRLLQVREQLRLPPAVTGEVESIFDRGAKVGFFKGRSMPDVVAALVYVVLRSPQFKIPADLAELTTASGGSEIIAGRIAKKIRRELHLKQWLPNSIDALMFHANRVRITNEERQMCRKILEDADLPTNEEPTFEKRNIPGSSPRSMVAGAIWIVSSNGKGTHRTQEQVAKSMGLTSVTVRTATKRLREMLTREGTRGPGDSVR